jgi:hypothetical protein
MFYDWLCISYGWLVEHPRVAICPSLCSGKKDKKEIKTLGSPPGGPLIKSFVNADVDPFTPWTRNSETMEIS